MVSCSSRNDWNYFLFVHYKLVSISYLHTKFVPIIFFLRMKLVPIISYLRTKLVPIIFYLRMKKCYKSWLHDIANSGSPWYWYKGTYLWSNITLGVTRRTGKQRLPGVCGGWAGIAEPQWGRDPRLRTQERRPGGLKRGKTAAAWQDYSWSWTACCLLNGIWSRKKWIFQIQRGVCVSLLESCPLKTESPNTLTRRSGCLLSCFHLSWNR